MTQREGEISSGPFSLPGNTMIFEKGKSCSLDKEMIAVNQVAGLGVAGGRDDKGSVQGALRGRGASPLRPRRHDHGDEKRGQDDGAESARDSVTAQTI